MRRYVEPFPDELSTGSVVTIGKFDGVHLGHRAVLGAAVQRAESLGLEAAVVTFDRNPLALLRPEACPPQIQDLGRRLEMLAQTGVDVTAVLRFDEARATQAPEEFVQELLVDRLHARVVMCDAAFRFGARAAGDIALLRAMGAEHGFEVDTVPVVGAPGLPRVSSSRIRELLQAGDVAGAAGLLGSLPALRGTVVPGNARGRLLGFPTANLGELAGGMIPADGVYAGRARIGGAGPVHPAAISISNNPTFGDVGEQRVEVHLLDFDQDIYGQELGVVFVERLRATEAFDSVDALVDQMRRDVARTREIFGQRPQ